jgi:hypothetical protein
MPEDEAMDNSNGNVELIKEKGGDESSNNNNNNTNNNNDDTSNAGSASSTSSRKLPQASTTTRNVTDEGESEKLLAKNETKVVFRLKLTMLAMLAAATAGVGYGVHRYISTSEQDSFESVFYDDSIKIFEALGSTLDQTLGAVDSFAASLVTYAQVTDAKWPFVTLPNYGVLGSKIRSLSKAVQISQYHLVMPEERLAWEAYSVQNSYWVKQDIERQKTDKTFDGLIVEDYTIFPRIFNNSIQPSPEQDFYLVIWQQAPIVPQFLPPYNWDASANDYGLMPVLDEVMAGKASISLVKNLADPNNPASIEGFKSVKTWIKAYIGPDEDVDEPFCSLDYPIMSGAADAVSVSPNSQNKKVVGILGVTFFWRDLVKDLLPNGRHDIVTVFDNGCGQSFTYEITGPDAVFLGTGDLHNSKYNGVLELSSRVDDLKAYSIRDSTYTGANLTNNFCPWEVHTYPSESMRDFYVTNDPIVFSLSAVGLSVAISIVFLMYDFLVERRQKRILHTGMFYFVCHSFGSTPSPEQSCNFTVGSPRHDP